MIKHIALSCVALVCLFGDVLLHAQDPQFTQFYANPLYLNPAFAGTAQCPRAVVAFRDQWPAISGTYVTYSASYDQHVDALGGGIGFLVTEDRQGQGTLNTINAAAMYSYQLNVTKEFSIRAGFEAAYIQEHLDWSKLTFGDMIDPQKGFVYQTAEVPGPSSKSNVDFSAGLLGYSKEYFFGLAVNHLTQPDMALLSGSALNNTSPLEMKITGHAGAVIPLEGDKGNASISPNIIYQYQGKFQELCLGMYITKGPLVGGLWYRNQDSFIALVGIQYDIYKIGYSYDVTVSSLSNATAGSHEVTLSMIFGCKPKSKKFRVVNCPSF